MAQLTLLIDCSDTSFADAASNLRVLADFLEGKMGPVCSLTVPYHDSDGNEIGEMELTTEIEVTHARTRI